jgi:hypothetical protein
MQTAIRSRRSRGQAWRHSGPRTCPERDACSHRECEAMIPSERGEAGMRYLPASVAGDSPLHAQITTNRLR